MGRVSSLLSLPKKALEIEVGANHSVVHAPPLYLTSVEAALSGTPSS